MVTGPLFSRKLACAPTDKNQEESNSMKNKILILGAMALASVFGSRELSAEVDESPISIKVVKAFPNIRVRRPVMITNAGDGSNRLFVVTQQGVIHVIPNDEGIEETTEFLDIESQVVYRDNKNEEGLLGLTFHPNYKENGHFFVYYTTTDAPQTSVVSRFTVSADNPNQADPDSELELMRVSQPFWNHNGGTVEFGPDGYLYIALGDGGKANDTLMNGQNVQTLLGSILRIDVDNPSDGQNYGIPEDNPFANAGRLARPEIYAYGFRNVWRLSFDKQTGLLWAADVGQDLWEEINIVRKGGNYGWNLREGNHKFGPVGAEPRPDLVDPIWEYDHKTGRSITGGHVYRGSKVPSLVGYYLYSDYVTGRFWALKYDPDSGQVTENRPLPNEPPASTIGAGVKPIMTYGIDEAGEVYCADALSNIFRFEAQ